MKKLLTLLSKGDDEMMKKMLVLMLVFGLASAANAVPMQLWVAHGEAPGGPPAQQDYYDPVDSELWLLPSDYLWVGVYNPVDGEPGEAQKPLLLLGLVTNPAIGWTGNWTMYQPPLVPGATDNYYMGGGMYMGPGVYVDMWALTLTDGAPDTYNLQGVLDAKELQCNAPSMDNTVMLLDSESFELLDTIIIHQVVPEPATIALLGLGSLFLRRRRK